MSDVIQSLEQKSAELRAKAQKLNADADAIDRTVKIYRESEVAPATPVARIEPAKKKGRPASPWPEVALEFLSDGEPRTYMAIANAVQATHKITARGVNAWLQRTAKDLGVKRVARGMYQLIKENAE